MLLTPILERAHPIAKVPSIGDRLEPRGMTQLCDAIALQLHRAERHGGDDADQLVVILMPGRASEIPTSSRCGEIFRQQSAILQAWKPVFESSEITSAGTSTSSRTARR